MILNKTITVAFRSIADAEQIETTRMISVIKTLIESGAFDVHGGSVTMHFDGDGELRKIEKDEIVFRK